MLTPVPAGFVTKKRKPMADLHKDSHIKDYHVHVEGGTNILTLNLRELWLYRDLILLFTKRTLALMYKQTILGPLWLVLNPLFTSVVYAAVFKGIAGISTEGSPALLFYLTSHSLWNLFASSLKRNSSTFVSNANIFGKVYFPRLTISVSSMLTSLVEFLVEFAMIFIMLLWYLGRGQVWPRWDLMWLLPIVLLQTGLIGMGLGVLVSSLTTKYRDLTFVVDFGVSLWMYATPVVYPFSQLQNVNLMYRVMILNPMTVPMELFRLIMLGQGTIVPLSVLFSAVFTLAALLGGMLIFNRVERSFIDTI
jgi:lipopolysaccharide transport system permease protein